VIGKDIGPYRVLAKLGEGGMGIVYRAHDPRLNRDVAIKVIQASQLGPDMEQRFQREAQLVAQMDHPAIVPIYDFGRHDETLYFVMALVDGTNLLGFLRTGPNIGDIVEIGIQVAEALEYSHARGVVHRDIKPENVMVARQPGDGLRVRVMDFGLARGGAAGRITKTGTLIGTLQYLSPEQIVSQNVDGRSDVYALGTVLYECVVGQPPFTGEPQSIVYRIVHEFPQPPRERGAAVDEALERLILGCLEKDRTKRPSGAGELAEELKRYRVELRDAGRTLSASAPTRALQVDRPAQAPLVGRARESAELQRRLNAAAAGECQFVIVGGEPGIGKTRLLDELEQLARARQIRVLHGRSVGQDRGLPFQEFFEVIFEHFRSRDGSSTPAIDLTDLAQELIALFPMLAEIPEVRSAAGSGPALERRGAPGTDSRAYIFELLARTLARIAAGRPLLVLIEDLHAADVSLEALEYIVRRLGPAPLLIVGTYRTTDVPARHPLQRLIEGFQGERRAVSLVLGPLSPPEHQSFLELLIGAAVTPSLVTKLYQGSEGNPFFTKELVRSLMDSGGIARDDTGVWDLSAKAALASDALPETIQKAVEKRIGRLPDELRDLLSVGSVIGRSFDARVERRPPQLFERHRARRALCGTVAPQTPLAASPVRRAHRDPSCGQGRARSAPARPPFFPGGRTGKDGRVCPASRRAVTRRVQRGRSHPVGHHGADLPRRGMERRAARRGRGAAAARAGAADEWRPRGRPAGRGSGHSRLRRHGRGRQARGRAPAGGGDRLAGPPARRCGTPG
jgi:hypothetical protein